MSELLKIKDKKKLQKNRRRRNKKSYDDLIDLNT